MKAWKTQPTVFLRISSFAALIIIMLGCSPNPSDVVVKIRRVQAQTKGDVILDCEFVGLPKDEKTAYKKRIVYTKTEDGWASAPSWAAGGFKRDFRRRVTFNYMEGYEPKFSLIDEAGEVEIAIPLGQNEVKVFVGTNAEGRRIELYIGYGKPLDQSAE